MDCCSQPNLLPLDDALARMEQALTSVSETDNVELYLALDRVLAENIFASINVPAADNSAMDGYAIRAEDVNSAHTQFTLIGQSLAGHPFIFSEEKNALSENEAIRIMTGATIPTGANAVVMQENTSLEQHTLIIHSSVSVGDNIRHAGDDIQKNSLVLEKGRRITALDIGLLSSLGISHISIFRQLRVAVLTTGDELLAAGETHTNGKIYDSNRPLLLALLQRLNVSTKDFGIIADDLFALRAAFLQAAEWADVIISTGGVSVGDADYTKTVLDELGEINFWKVAIKPGKPFAFGKLKNSWFFGLPGNPVSTAVTYHQLVVPGLRKLSGETNYSLIKISAITQDRLKKQPGRIDFQRGFLFQEAGKNIVKSAGSQSSGVLSSMAKANCYICLEAERGSVDINESVTVIPFDETIR